MVSDQKAFLCHASEDKERFVIEFATKLTDRGVDVWFAHWEMLPGDRLVEKIFDEGIKNARIFIVVLSKNSINRPWVKEELNTAVIKRIEEDCKIIPIILDDCEIPEALKSTYWIRIKDLSNYEKELDEIVAAIFDHRHKPLVGEGLQHSYSSAKRIGSLSMIDSSILTLACEEANSRGHLLFIPIETIMEKTAELGFHKDQILESLENLELNFMVRLKKVLNSERPVGAVSVTETGYEEYARTCIENYDDIEKSVISEIVNLQHYDSLAISASINLPIRLVNHILVNVQSRRLIKVRESKGGTHNITIYDISPVLKRGLE